jgi:hypothetical protein
VVCIGYYRDSLTCLATMNRTWQNGTAEQLVVTTTFDEN